MVGNMYSSRNEVFVGVILSLKLNLFFVNKLIKIKYWDLYVILKFVCL